MASNKFKVSSTKANGIKINNYYYAGKSAKIYNVNLSAFGGLDISGEHSEVESIQIIDENHGYLTVAYHANVNGKNKTVSNKVYELAWD